MAGQVGTAVPRRAVLAALLLGPPLVACAPARPTQAQAPDPLIALAQAARTDAALASAVIGASPDLAARVGPLRDARTEHAAALEAEVARQAGQTVTAAPPRPDAPGPAGLDALRRSVAAAGESARQVALSVDAQRVGLVASVAACCTTYAGLLG
jgi:hypothetical protein